MKPCNPFSDLEMSILEYSINYVESEPWIFWKKNIFPFVRFLYSGLKLTWEAGTNNNYSLLFFNSPLGLESTSSSFFLRLMKNTPQAGLVCAKISHIFCMCHLGKVSFKERIWIILLIFSSYRDHSLTGKGCESWGCPEKKAPARL